MKNGRVSQSVKAHLGFALLVLLLFAQIGGQAQTTPLRPLPYSRGFLLTGNYVVSGIDLTETRNPPDLDGISSGTIHMSAVPADADIIAAYLFWETITLTSDPSQATVKFRGQDIDLANANIVALKNVPLDLVGSSSTCWSSGVPLTSHMYRADVLSMLPLRLDKDDRNTGKRLVNDADLTAYGFGLNTVALPTRNGNQIPESAGASLVIVYHDPSEPLRKIMIYDDANVALGSITETLEQDLHGFYKSSATPSARITHIVASGQPNNNDRILFNGTPIVTNAFGTGSLELTDPNDPTSFSEGGSSQRAWGNPTREVGQYMNPSASWLFGGLYGETATTKVEHVPTTGGQDCLTWGGVIFSTAVADEDHDGLPDGLEDATGLMKDPDGVDLPSLNAMGASSSHKDLFLEISAMWAEPNTTYGSPTAPFSPTQNSITDLVGHVHLPTPEDIKRLGDAYAAQGITAHVDLGDIGPGSYYRNLGVIQHADWEDDYTSHAADNYFVTVDVRGGELIKEKACVSTSTNPCQFPDYPGTVGWKFGLKAYRDGPVGDLGEEIAPEDLDDWIAGTVHRRRFDRVRRDLFHYLLYAHGRGRPKSPLPCLVDGQPAPYDANNGTSCTTDNPLFHVPTTSGGIGDQPGGNILITLGFWDEFLGKPFIRASTTFHELGHNGNLWHGGLPAILGSKALNTATYIEPNCKPFYRSSVNYMYQVHGLYDNNDNIHIDYSNEASAATKETDALPDAAVLPTGLYQPAWYAPAGSALAQQLGVSAATRFCSGAKFDPLAPPAAMARVHTTLTSDNVDWNGDKTNNQNLASQDVNFDNVVTGPTKALNGFNDWLAFRLDQIGAGHNFRLASASSDTGVAEGDTGQAESDSGQAESDSGQAESDSGQAESDTGQGESDTGQGEADSNLFTGIENQVTFEGAKESGRPRPYGLSACVTGRDAGCDAGRPASPANHRIKLTWNASNYSTALYLVERKRGNAASTNPFVQVGTATGNYFVDVEMPNGIEFTYRIRSRFDDVVPSVFSDYSNTDTETAVNDAPIAFANTYPAMKNTTLTVPAPGVVGNDTDVDTPVTSLQAVLVVACNKLGTLTFGLNGAFTYRPKNGVANTTEICQYQANSGTWTVDLPHVPMSLNSGTQTVSFVIPK